MYNSTKLKKQGVDMSLEERAEISKMLRQIQLQKLSISYYPAIEPNFKRVQYTRYADDFLVGVIGSRADAEQIKADLKQFLQEKLQLILSEEKTKVTHSSEFIRFLGYDLTVSRDRSFIRNKDGSLVRVHYGKVRLYLPNDKWVGKLREYKAFKIKKDKNGKESWKALHRGFLMNKTEIEIISKYNSEIRGIYNYYRLASNVSVLGVFRWMMETSMLKTFAAKYNSSINKVKVGRIKNGVFGVDYTTKSGPKRCEFHNDRLVKQDKPAPDFSDILPQYRRYDKTNSLAARLRRGVCEMCSSNTDSIKMHHVKSLKSLKSNTPSEMLMMQKRRKTLALCEACFEQVSKGYL